MKKRIPRIPTREFYTIPKIRQKEKRTSVAVHGKKRTEYLPYRPNIPWFGASPWLASWSLSPYVAALDERQRPAPLLQRCCANVPGPDPNTLGKGNMWDISISSVAFAGMKCGERAVFFSWKWVFFVFVFSGFWSYIWVLIKLKTGRTFKHNFWNFLKIYGAGLFAICFGRSASNKNPWDSSCHFGAANPISFHSAADPIWSS